MSVGVAKKSLMTTDTQISWVNYRMDHQSQFIRHFDYAFVNSFYFFWCEQVPIKVKVHDQLLQIVYPFMRLVPCPTVIPI